MMVTKVNQKQYIICNRNNAQIDLREQVCDRLVMELVKEMLEVG